MQTRSSYETYRNCLIDIVDLLGKEEVKQGTIARNERNSVSTVENNYMQIIEELTQAEKTVRAQYRNVWDSCTKYEGLMRPKEQRPSATQMNWKEAVSKQEKAAAKIREWFSEKKQQAYVERQLKLQEEARRQAAATAAREEAARIKAEEEAREERERGKKLIEYLKRKHRKNH